MRGTYPPGDGDDADGVPIEFGAAPADAAAPVACMLVLSVDDAAELRAAVELAMDRLDRNADGIDTEAWITRARRLMRLQRALTRPGT